MRLLILAAALVSAAALQQNPRITLQGRVVRAGSAEPIPGVQVVLTAAGAPRRADSSVLAGGSGQPTVVTSDSPALGPGRYDVRVQREGYFGTPVNGVPAVALTMTVDLRPEQCTTLFRWLIRMSSREVSPESEKVNDTRKVL